MIDEDNQRKCGYCKKYIDIDNFKVKKTGEYYKCCSPCLEYCKNYITETKTRKKDPVIDPTSLYCKYCKNTYESPESFNFKKNEKRYIMCKSCRDYYYHTMTREFR